MKTRFPLDFSFYYKLNDKNERRALYFASWSYAIIFWFITLFACFKNLFIFFFYVK